MFLPRTDRQPAANVDACIARGLCQNGMKCRTADARCARPIQTINPCDRIFEMQRPIGLAHQQAVPRHTCRDAALCYANRIKRTHGVGEKREANAAFIRKHILAFDQNSLDALAG